MNDTNTFWQRCEALSQFEDYHDNHIDMRYEAGRWVLYHHTHPIILIYKDRMQGSPWLAEAILSHIENERNKGEVGEQQIEKLPDVTYVVEAPKATEPTQAQLRALEQYICDLGYAYKHENIKVFDLGIISGELGFRVLFVNGDTRNWGIDIAIHRGDGHVYYRSELSLQDICERIGFDLKTLKPTYQGNLSSTDCISIPITQWKEIKAALDTLSRNFHNVTQPTPLEA